MNRRSSSRLCLVATLLLPATAILSAACWADAQPGGMHLEKVWKCSKCGGNLGNGVNPPTSCPHCNTKLRAPRTANWPDSPAPNYPRTQAPAADAPSSTTGRIVAFLIIGLAIVGLGFIVMRDRVA